MIVTSVLIRPLIRHLHKTGYAPARRARLQPSTATCHQPRRDFTIHLLFSEMGSRLPYYRNVIEKADGLVRGGVGTKPIWLDVAKRFPPLSKPVNGELPKAHVPVRVGPNLNTDGHR